MFGAPKLERLGYGFNLRQLICFVKHLFAINIKKGALSALC